MNKTGKNISFIVSVFVLAIFAFGTGKAMGIDPGSNRDPLVSKSYVDAQIEEVMKLLVDMSSDDNSKTSQGAMTYEIVNVDAGQKLVGGQGTEVILRGGKGLAITSELGGLQDMTDGVDISSGQSIPKYHLLIIPREDGRGIYVESDAVFMIRGSYEILP